MPNVLSRSLFNLFFGARRKPLESLPGPQPGILGTAGDFLGTPPWQVSARYGREYGGVTLVWLPFSPALVLNDPTLIEQVLGSRSKEFEKGTLTEQQFTPSITTHSLVVARINENWPAMRRADPLEQPWTADWLAAQVEPMPHADRRRAVRRSHPTRRLEDHHLQPALAPRSHSLGAPGHLRSLTLAGRGQGAGSPPQRLLLSVWPGPARLRGGPVRHALHADGAGDHRLACEGARRLDGALRRGALVRRGPPQGGHR